MTRKDSDRSAFEERTREVFERSVADLDGATRSKLTQARHRALHELQQPSIARQWLAWSPQAAAAALVVASVGAGWLVMQNGTDVGPVATVEVVSDFELLLGEEELDLIEELEFYAWLDEQPEFNEDGAG